MNIYIKFLLLSSKESTFKERKERKERRKEGRKEGHSVQTFLKHINYAFIIYSVLIVFSTHHLLP